MVECSNIISRYNGYLTQAIVDPVSIAGDFHQNGIITLDVKQNAELTTIPANYRTAQLLTAVHRSIKGDFQPPKMFTGTIDVLKRHAETKNIANQMEADYYGKGETPRRRQEDSSRSVFYEDRYTEEIDYPDKNDQHRHGNVQQQREEPLGTESSVHENIPQDSTQTPYIELPSTVIGPVRINRLLFDDLRSWTGRHPVVTTIVAVPLVAIAAYYIYRKFM